MDPAEIVKQLSGLTAREFATVRGLIAEEADVELSGSATLASTTRANSLVASAEILAAPSVRQMARGQRGVVRSPERGSGRSRAVLTASGNLRGVAAGAQIDDRWAFARALCATLAGMDRQGPARGPVLVASASWEYPEDRQLTDDQSLNAQRIDAVTHPDALLASGGICAPGNVDYTVPTWASALRPLRDGLPSFQATRGALRYVTPPSIADVSSSTEVWTEATDASPGELTKPVYHVTCGEMVEVFVDAIPTRLGFGNMAGRFAPEQMAANVDLAAAYAARVAEDNLLDSLAAACIAGVTSAKVLGATRDLLTVINQAAAGLRSRHRIASSTMLTAVFPAWVRDLVRVDLAREIAHAQDAGWNSLMVTDDMVTALLRASGANPIFHLDGQPNTVAGGVAQTFPAQSASGAINPFPGKMVWYLFPEGSVQFLDGGRLDLGVVRDSVLDATNDFELFVEPFEQLAFRGFTGAAIQYVSTLCANGTSAGTVDTTASCA
jgi:hypothetical protein